MAGIFRCELGRAKASRIRYTRRRWGRRRCKAGGRRLFESCHEGFAAGIPAEEWSPLRRECGRGGVFRKLQGAEWRYLACRDGHRDRSPVSGSTLPDKLAIQKASRCFWVESHAMRGEIARRPGPAGWGARIRESSQEFSRG